MALPLIFETCTDGATGGLNPDSAGQRVGIEGFTSYEKAEAEIGSRHRSSQLRPDREGDSRMPIAAASTSPAARDAVIGMAARVLPEGRGPRGLSPSHPESLAVTDSRGRASGPTRCRRATHRPGAAAHSLPKSWDGGATRPPVAPKCRSVP